MRRTGTAQLAACLIAAAGFPAGTAVAAAATTATATPRVQLRHTDIGTILVNGHGSTLYVFTRDARAQDRCVAINGCASVWPLLTTTGRTIAGRGVNPRLLGSIRVGHGRQVTYGGHPLYTYIGDSGPGSTAYVGVAQFGGSWYALNAGDRVVR